MCHTPFSTTFLIAIEALAQNRPKMLRTFLSLIATFLTEKCRVLRALFFTFFSVSNFAELNSQCSLRVEAVLQVRTFGAGISCVAILRVLLFGAERQNCNAGLGKTTSNHEDFLGGWTSWLHGQRPLQEANHPRRIVSSLPTRGSSSNKKVFFVSSVFVLVSMSNVQKICQIILEFQIFRDIIFLIKYTYITFFISLLIFFINIVLVSICVMYCRSRHPSFV